MGPPDDVWMKLHLMQPTRIHGLFVREIGFERNALLKLKMFRMFTLC